MKGVLYVSHGSRIAEATEEAITFINSVQETVDVSLQEICFLELSKPTIEEATISLINQGASEIYVIPVLLLSAGHYYKDIPEVIEELRLRYPFVPFIYGKPLGVQERLSHILVERLKDTNIDVKEDAKILIVGRGSYNPQTKKDISLIAEQFKNRTGFKDVETCYLAACKPSFEESLERAIDDERSQIFIVPYLWFTGVLERHIEKTARETNNESDIIVCKHLGHHEAIRDALKERVQEAMTYKNELQVR